MPEEGARDRMGRIIENLQGLEFLLRATLFKINDLDQTDFKVDQLIEGSEVAENSFTNYKSLNELINEFNLYIRNNQLGIEISKESVDIRDMFAHGRVSSEEMNGIPTLIKFGRKNRESGLIPVERVSKLDNEWLDNAVQKIWSDIQLVIKVSRSLDVVTKIV